MSKAEKNARQRRELFEKQKGRCFYCTRHLQPMAATKAPVLEHFVPRHAGGRRSAIVLACDWCDKTKGPLHGAVFLKIIAELAPRGELDDVEFERAFALAQPLIRSAADRKKGEVYRKIEPSQPRRRRAPIRGNR